MTKDEALAREGDAWVLLMTSGAPTREDARALRLWRRSSAAHEQAFRKAVRLRQLVRVAADDLRTGEAAAPARRPGLSRRWVVGGGIAASVATVGVLAGGQGLRPWPAGADADFATAKGQHRVVALDDGVSAELNTMTRLRRRPDIGVHGVELISGEVMLNARVSKDAPLVVVAGGGKTQAADARFGLRCDGAGVVVTCLDGAVSLEAAGERLIVPSGRQVTYGRQGVGELVTIDPEVATAWQRGVLVFRRQTVDAVIAEINRYRPGRIVVADPALAQRQIDGTFYVGQFDQVFEQLHSAYGAGVTRLPGGLVILS